MLKMLGRALSVVAVFAAPSMAPLSAQEKSAPVVSPAAFPGGSRFLLEQLQTIAEGTRITASRPGPSVPSLSSSAQTPQPAEAKKKGGRKIVWITLAASVAAVSVAAALAPEAPIPTTPSRTSGGCTNFYRPGTLMTTSGYTCTSR